MRPTARILAALGLALALSPVPAFAQKWDRVRDAAMTLREQGRAQDAYALVTAAKVQTASEESDRQFLSGFLAMRTLGRNDLALVHFQKMAYTTTQLRAAEQPWARATAGYWLGRVLQSQGRAAEARKLYEAGALYRDSFYGLMSASQAGLSDTSTAVAPVAANYPRMQFYQIDPRVREELALAVIKPESNFNPVARSPAGALGIMQLMPDTARAVGRRSGVDIDMRQVATNPHYNVIIGTKLFGDLLDRYRGNVMLAAAAYNAGSDRADEWLRRFGDPRTGQVDAVDFVELIPFKETRNYVKKVVAAYVTYLALSPVASNR